MVSRSRCTSRPPLRVFLSASVSVCLCVSVCVCFVYRLLCVCVICVPVPVSSACLCALRSALCPILCPSSSVFRSAISELPFWVVRSSSAVPLTRPPLDSSAQWAEVTFAALSPCCFAFLDRSISVKPRTSVKRFCCVFAVSSFQKCVRQPVRGVERQGRHESDLVTRF